MLFSKAHSLFLSTALLSGVCSVGGHAAETELSGSIEIEARGFFEEASSPDQEDWDLSLALEATLEVVWDGGDQNFVFTPFARWDRFDDNRTHGDIREARWLGAFDNIEVRVGADKVFWGVTEVAHLIDIVNQTDLVESMDGEDKLGQPMVSLGMASDVGTFEFFYLPYFRERTFEDFEGRPRFDLPVDTDQTFWEDSDEEHHQDFALRWSHYFGDFDIGLSYFEGTGRQPLLSPGLDADFRPVLIPMYVQIAQTSIDVQATIGSWLYKFEGLTRDEFGDTYAQATGGIEYSFYGIFETAQDLGLVVEYVWDERGELAPNPLNNDGFVGLRWARNDEQSTSLLAGVLTDFDHQGWSFRLRERDVLRMITS